jgi:short-subunit dehydrogenase
MSEKKHGFIININSVASKKLFSGTSIYSASKAALDCISNTLRDEVRESNVQVSNVYPGATETEIWDDEFREARADEMMKPEDVANAILKLVELKYQHSIVPEELVLRPKGGDL